MKLLLIIGLIALYSCSHSETVEWTEESNSDLAVGHLEDGSKLEMLMEYGRHSSRFVPLEGDNVDVTTLTTVGLMKAFERGQWLREQYPQVFDNINLPEDASEVYFKSTNTSRTIMSTLAQNIGSFGEKRCIEKFDEFLIARPKTDSFESLDALMDESRLYELCFKPFDNLLYITPAGQSSVGNVY